ncbi:hypothetical protein [Clostridium minihomine]|uniref:hypothetical protein n=1 Tax=Clostridium minihomine TaxID=2045012 RepID=UPI000C7835E3|nr:hypothetical protein [Clostridium minihomine]
MKQLLKSHKVRLLALATAISLFAGVFPIRKESFVHVSHFGFPTAFITLHRPISEFPVGLEINLLQFAGNIGVIWLILFYLSKVFHKLVLKVRKKQDTV